MQTSTPIPKAKLAEFKAAGQGYPEPEATERIVMYIFNHFQRRGEITVVNENGDSDLFRIGEPSPPWHRGPEPSHEIATIHVHAAKFNQLLDKHFIPSSSKKNPAFPLATSPERELYLEYLFTALEKGEFRIGHKK